LLEEDEDKIEDLRAEIRKAIESGIAEDFDPAEFLGRIKKE